MINSYIIKANKISDNYSHPNKSDVYAAIDNQGPYSSGFPCWTYFDSDGLTFVSIEEAKSWFSSNANYLMKDSFGIDYNSITICKVSLEEIERI